MKRLWKLINKYCPEDAAVGIFLAVNIIIKTAVTFVFGMMLCHIAGHIAVADCITGVMCAAIYAGIIFGLFGGIIYLMRCGRHL